jgi:hypothetical protein
VPADRPGTAAAARAAAIAADDSDAARLAALWDAELPAAAWRDDFEGDSGDDCPDCGKPRQWAGAHTVLVCPACGRRFASPGAIEREARYARANAAPGRAAGPSAAELERVAEDRAVALDVLAGVRERLSMIPRGDDWRQDAVRGQHKLEQLEQRYKAARSAAELEAADDAAEVLADELGDVLSRADKLARQQTRRGRIGSLLRFRRGADDEYELDDDGDYDDDGGEALEARPPGLALAYVPPDPGWRRNLPPEGVAYYDRITPPAAAAVAGPADDFWSRWDTEAGKRARAAAVEVQR